MSMNQVNRTNMRHARGFTMLEVLIALVVLSIGLLGLAGLMASSLKNTHSAYHRTQAAWLAYDALDRMRANRQVALAGGYNLGLGASPGGSGLAASDLSEWGTTLGNALPGGAGSITVNADRTATIVVQWNDARGTGGSASQQFRVDTQL